MGEWPNTCISKYFYVSRELAYAHGFRPLEGVRRAEDKSKFKNLIENKSWASGGIGIRARLRTVSERVEVRVLSRPPRFFIDITTLFLPYPEKHRTFDTIKLWQPQ